MSEMDLRITLKSDLCAGSGYAYAGVIDSDVCYDDCGIPYIPARRLKGCLREAAEMLGLTASEQESLFGERGANAVRGVMLEDAYIEGYESLHESIKSLPHQLKEYVTPQSILEQFTDVKAQTKLLESGVAQDNSLRFTRKVNQYSPLRQGEALCFISHVELADLTEQDEANFEMTVKALRNMGLNRNRGLGSIKCTLAERTEDLEREADSQIIDDETEYTLFYSVRNTAPLVMPGRREDRTERYISGQSVLGCFASAYLRKGGNADDDMFHRLFLRNEVMFSALYPCEGGLVYYPAPSYINRLKKTKEYVNVSKKITAQSGNQPKKLKDRFVCRDENGISVKEVGTEIIYHHTKKSSRQDAENGELLYSFEAVSKGQTFAGRITGKGKQIRVLCDLISGGTLRFGRSKSAQYGTCRVESIEVKKCSDEKQTYPEGSRILVTLQSDGIFMGERGHTVSCFQVREIIREKLGIVEMENTSGELYAEADVKELIGYYAKWNLKRQSIPVICAGSSFEFYLDRELIVSDMDLYAGERNGEGYGRLIILKNDGEDCIVPERRTADSSPAALSESAQTLCRQILLKEIRETLRNEAMKTSSPIQNPSALGRITLMLTESLNRYPDRPEKAYEDFCERIGSIKKKEKRDEIDRIRKDLICAEDKLEKEKARYLQKGSIKKLLVLYENLYDEEHCREMEETLKGLWGDYFMHVLIQEKYAQKGRKS